MKPLKKRLENIFKNVIQAEFDNLGITVCSVITGHSRQDKPEPPYLTVVAKPTKSDEFPEEAGVWQSEIILIMVSDTTDEEVGKTETDIDNYIDYAICEATTLANLQAETQANFTDIHIHYSEHVDEDTDFEGCAQYDMAQLFIDCEYIDPPP